jgi:crossover junction endodeoxyribonuclease RuvC
MAVRLCESEPDLERTRTVFCNGKSPVGERVVGIDPGLHVTGYAVVDPSSRGPFVLEAGVIRPSSRCVAMGQRLDYLHRAVAEVLDAFPPGAVALERVHSHVRFPRTAILMGHARGVILLTAQRRGLRIEQFAANRIKQSLTGFGHASKSQMQKSIQAMWNLKDPPEPPDVADALAVALCAGRATTRVRA